jgi:hypothetical protein
MADDGGAAAFSTRMEKVGAEAFERWMRSPTTKLIISLIPPGQHPEVLQTLLREAFDFGAHVGQTQIAGEIVGRMLKDQKP